MSSAISSVFKVKVFHFCHCSYTQMCVSWMGLFPRFLLQYFMYTEVQLVLPLKWFTSHDKSCCPLITVYQHCSLLSRVEISLHLCTHIRQSELITIDSRVTVIICFLFSISLQSFSRSPFKRSTPGSEMHYLTMVVQGT